MRRTSKPSFVIHPVIGVMVLSLASCGGDDCVDCSDPDRMQITSVCPALDVQCRFGWATVQQCAATAGGKSCCVMQASEVSCRMVAPLDTDVGYRLENGLVRFQMISAEGSHCVSMDPIENGWISKGMSAAEQDAIIARKMAEVFAIAATLDDDDVAPRSPRATTPVDPGGGW